MSVVKKKKYVSKKTKKGWRKSDIRDVEEFLEDQRLEERLGKFDLKPDAELFVVDTGGDEVAEEKPLSAKLRKRAKLSELPKCFEHLLPSSAVQDPNAKRNHVNPAGTKPTALSRLTEKRRLAKGVYEKKVELAKKNRKIGLDKKRKVKQGAKNFGLDLWGQDLPEAKGIPTTLVDDFISPEAQLHNVLPDRRLRSKPPLSKTVVTRAAVEPPHPGVSYNPSFKEHQELLQQVVQHEQKLIKKQTHLHRVTTGMFSKVTQQEKENTWREEMSAGLPVPHKPTDDDDEKASGDEYKAINPPVKNKKKDQKARRKQKERLLEKERIKREKIDKKKITDLYKLRKLESSIQSTERRQSSQRSARAARRSRAAAAAAPALNKHKLPAHQPEFVDPAVLTGNLAMVTNNTNLLRDRYESLQRRGALAGAKLMMKKKRKLKSYFKPGHKVTEQDIEKYVNKKK